MEFECSMESCADETGNPPDTSAVYNHPKCCEDSSALRVSHFSIMSWYFVELYTDSILEIFCIEILIN